MISSDFLWFPLLCVCVYQSKKSPLTTECTRNLLICFLWVIKNADESVVRQWWSELNVNVLAQILDVLYFCISNFEYKVSPHWLSISQMSVIQRQTITACLKKVKLGKHFMKLININVTVMISTLGSFRFEVNVMICFKKRWCIKELFEKNNLEIGFSVS